MTDEEKRKQAEKDADEHGLEGAEREAFIRRKMNKGVSDVE